MAKEAQLWKWLSGRLPEGHFCRVESGDTSPGIPDVYGRLPGSRLGTRSIVTWLELKVESSPTAKKPLKKRGLRPDQIRWINTELGSGGSVWIVVRLGKRVHFVNGFFADKINDWDRKTVIHGAELTLTQGDRDRASQTENIRLLLRDL